MLAVVAPYPSAGSVAPYSSAGSSGTVPWCWQWWHRTLVVAPYPSAGSGEICFYKIRCVKAKVTLPNLTTLNITCGG